MDVYEKIDSILEKKNISRRKLAILAGIPPTTLQSAFSRKTTNLSLESIEKIAKVLEVSPFELIGWSYFDMINPNIGDEVKLIGTIEEKYGEKAVDLLDFYSQLNDSGKAKAIDFVSDLSMIEKYQNKKS